MRTLRKNWQRLYYANKEKTAPAVDENGDYTGDTMDIYEEPVEFHANISPNQGDSYARPFALELDYERTIAVTNKYPIKEGTLIWKDTEPPDDINDGKTADYYVVAVAESLNSTLYAVKTVTKNGA